MSDRFQRTDRFGGNSRFLSTIVNRLQYGTPLSGAGRGSEQPDDSRQKIIDQYLTMEGEAQFNYGVAQGLIPPGSKYVPGLSKDDADWLKNTLETAPDARSFVGEQNFDQVMDDIKTGRATQGYYITPEQQAQIDKNSAEREKWAAKMHQLGEMQIKLKNYQVGDGYNIAQALSDGKVTSNQLLDIGFTREQIEQSTIWLQNQKVRQQQIEQIINENLSDYTTDGKYFNLDKALRDGVSEDLMRDVGFTNTQISQAKQHIQYIDNIESKMSINCKIGKEGWNLERALRWKVITKQEALDFGFKESDINKILGIKEGKPTARDFEREFNQLPASAKDTLVYQALGGEYSPAKGKSFDELNLEQKQKVIDWYTYGCIPPEVMRKYEDNSIVTCAVGIAAPAGAEPTPIGEVAVLTLLTIGGIISLASQKDRINRAVSDFKAEYGRNPTSDEVYITNEKGESITLTQLLQTVRFSPEINKTSTTLVPSAISPMTREKPDNFQETRPLEGSLRLPSVLSSPNTDIKLESSPFPLKSDISKQPSPFPLKSGLDKQLPPFPLPEEAPASEHILASTRIRQPVKEIPGELPKEWTYLPGKKQFIKWDGENLQVKRLIDETGGTSSSSGGKVLPGTRLRSSYYSGATLQDLDTTIANAFSTGALTLEELQEYLRARNQYLFSHGMATSQLSLNHYMQQQDISPKVAPYLQTQTQTDKNSAEREKWAVKMHQLGEKVTSTEWAISAATVALVSVPFVGRLGNVGRITARTVEAGALTTYGVAMVANWKNMSAADRFINVAFLTAISLAIYRKPIKSVLSKVYNDPALQNRIEALGRALRSQKKDAILRASGQLEEYGQAMKAAGRPGADTIILQARNLRQGIAKGKLSMPEALKNLQLKIESVVKKVTVNQKGSLSLDPDDWKIPRKAEELREQRGVRRGVTVEELPSWLDFDYWRGQGLSAEDIYEALKVSGGNRSLFEKILKDKIQVKKIMKDLNKQLDNMFKMEAEEKAAAEKYSPEELKYITFPEEVKDQPPEVDIDNIKPLSREAYERLFGKEARNKPLPAGAMPLANEETGEDVIRMVEIDKKGNPVRVWLLTVPALKQGFAKIFEDEELTELQKAQLAKFETELLRLLKTKQKNKTLKELMDEAATLAKTETKLQNQLKNEFQNQFQTQTKTETQTKTLLKPSTQTQTQTVTKTDTPTETVPEQATKPLPPDVPYEPPPVETYEPPPDKKKKPKDDEEPELSNKRVRVPHGSVTWKQGFGWITRRPPYHQKHTLFTRRKPIGAIVTNNGKRAADTIQTITGLPPNKVPKFDMGVFDVIITRPPARPQKGNRQTIRFRPDPMFARMNRKSSNPGLTKIHKARHGLGYTRRSDR